MHLAFAYRRVATSSVAHTLVILLLAAFAGATGASACFDTWDPTGPFMYWDARVDPDCPAWWNDVCETDYCGEGGWGDEGWIEYCINYIYVGMYPGCIM